MEGVVGTWGGHEDGYGDVQGEQDRVVGHEKETGRWSRPPRDGQRDTGRGREELEVTMDHEDHHRGDP